MFDYNNLIGRQIDQFRLDQFIARGAMGLVLRAFDTVLVRTVALKLIPKRIETALSPAEASAMEVARKRLVQEAKAAGRLSHPNIVTIHSYGESDEFEYICMEYVNGVTLAQVLQSRTTLSADEAVSTFEQILRALEAAHGQQIVHRDIKPSNIMITDDKRVKVMDFGIAKLPSLSVTMSMTMTVLGTPYYMSPEQISGQKIDRRSDIFSLGAVLYECLTGEKPFLADNTATLAYKIVQTDPVPPRVLDIHLPQDLSFIVMKAMAKDPAQRYHTAAEMLNDLSALAEGTGLRTGGAVPFQRERQASDAGMTLQRPVAAMTTEALRTPDNLDTKILDFPAGDRQTVARNRETAEEAVCAPESEHRIPEPTPEPAPIETSESSAPEPVREKGKSFDPLPFARGIGAKLGDWPVVAFSVIFAIVIVVLGFALLKKSPADSMPKEPAVSREEEASSFSHGALQPSPAPFQKAPVAGNQARTATEPVPIPQPAPVVPVARAVPMAPLTPETRVASVAPSVRAPEAVPVVSMTSVAPTAPVFGQVASINQPGPAAEQRLPQVDNLVESAKALFQSNPVEARKLLLDAIERDPENYEPHMQLGRLLTFNKDYDGAIQQYRNALRINSQAPEIYFNLGFIYMNRRAFQLARENYRNCLALSPPFKDEVLTNLGMIELKEGHFVEARKLFEEALELNSDNSIAKKHLMNLEKTDPRK